LSLRQFFAHAQKNQKQKHKNEKEAHQGKENQQDFFTKRCTLYRRYEQKL